MLQTPNIDPVAFHLGPLAVHWYGLMYLFSFILIGVLAYRRIQAKQVHWTQDDLLDLLFYGALGVIIGGRCGYVFFYNGAVFLTDPLMLFKIWQGGMSFHGGLLGVLLALKIFAIKKRTPYLAVTDFIAPMVPIGLAAGRLGNFINGELWGRVTDVPWAMVFPNAGTAARHPSQLYECLLEGGVLFAVLWCYAKKQPQQGRVSAAFLVGYGCVRCIAELFRQPDASLGFIAFDWLTMGQLLSFPMILFGLALWFWVVKKRESRF